MPGAKVEAVGVACNIGRAYHRQIGGRIDSAPIVSGVSMPLIMRLIQVKKLIVLLLALRTT